MYRVIGTATNRSCVDQLTSMRSEGKDIVSTSTLFEGFGSTDMQSSINELNKYGDMKSTILTLIQQAERLKEVVDSLKEENNHLDNYNKQGLYNLAYLKRAVNFLTGAAVSLRNELKWVMSIFPTMYVLITMKLKMIELSCMLKNILISLSVH